MPSESSSGLYGYCSKLLAKEGDEKNWNQYLQGGYGGGADEAGDILGNEP